MVNENEKFVGTVKFRGQSTGEVFNGVYSIKKNPEHFMKMYNGFGISFDLMLLLAQYGVKYVQMIYSPPWPGCKKRIYDFHLLDFFASTKTYNDTSKYPEGDMQYFVSVPEAEAEEIKEEIKRNGPKLT